MASLRLTSRWDLLLQCPLLQEIAEKYDNYDVPKHVLYRSVKYDSDRLRSIIKTGTDRDNTSYGNSDIFATDRPSKLFEYLSDGDATIMVYDQEGLEKVSPYGYNFKNRDKPPLKAVIIMPRNVVEYIRKRI